MLGKMLCVLGGVVLGYVAREEISEIVENVMETFNEQSSSDSGNECPAEDKAAPSDGASDAPKGAESSPSMA